MHAMMLVLADEDAVVPFHAIALLFDLHRATAGVDQKQFVSLVPDERRRHVLFASFSRDTDAFVDMNKCAAQVDLSHEPKVLPIGPDVQVPYSRIGVFGNRARPHFFVRNFTSTYFWQTKVEAIEP
jgi:hypothetical protein